MSLAITRTAAVAALLSPLAATAAALEGQAEKQSLNLTAILMFLAFVAATLGITYWAARRTQSRADFYTAGGGITWPSSMSARKVANSSDGSRRATVYPR